MATLSWKAVASERAVFFTWRASSVENLFQERFFGCRFLSSLFDVPVESGIYSEGDKDAIHDADDPQGI
jgi:hypothetical protein